MAKFDYRTLTPKENKELLHELAKLIQQSKSKKNVQQLFGQLLTPSEVAMIGRRVLIARQLLKGYSYQHIRSKLKVGLSTIRTVDRWLEQDIDRYQEIRHYHRKTEIAQAKVTQRRQSTVPGTLAHTIRHDSRFILVRLLLGDF